MYERKTIMTIQGYPVRTGHVVWRDIAGEVVIAERDNSTLHVLNRTASLIWSLADGSRQIADIALEVCRKFEVDLEEAALDVEEFCRQLIEEGLITIEGSSDNS